MSTVRVSERGFTFAEIMVAAGVLVAVAAGFVMFQMSRANMSERDAMVADARAAYDLAVDTVSTQQGHVHTGVAPAYLPTPFEGHADLVPDYDLVLVGGTSAATVCVEAHSPSGSVVSVDAAGVFDATCTGQGPDADGDGFGNLTEILTGADPEDPASTPWTDDDEDGFANLVEIDAASNPFDAADTPEPTPGDTDGDRFADSLEASVGTDPLDARSIPGDWDGDTVFDLEAVSG